MNTPPLFVTGMNEWIAKMDDELDVEDTIDAIFAPVEVDDSQLVFDLFDEDEEYGIEDDHEWIRRGC